MKFGFAADIHYGIDEDRPSSEVKAYKLAPEEHAKYLEDEPRLKARKLAKANLWMTPKDVAELTGLPLDIAKKIVYYERQQRHNKLKQKP